MDHIQTLLVAWLRDGGPDRPAIDALCREWRPIIRRFLLEPDEDEVEDALQQALLTLVLSRRVVAETPDDGRAWRRRILKNHLTDTCRKRGRRQHAERAVGKGLAPQAERQAWREQKGSRRAPRLDLNEPRTVGLSPPVAELDEEALDLHQMRVQAMAALPAVPVGRRVLIALCLGMDPSPWAEELAAVIPDSAEAVLGRMDEARRAVQEHGSDPFLIEVARVVNPRATDTETAKRTFRRARKDLEQSMGGQR